MSLLYLTENYDVVTNILQKFKKKVLEHSRKNLANRCKKYKQWIQKLFPSFSLEVLGKFMFIYLSHVALHHAFHNDHMWLAVFSRVTLSC